MDISNWTNYNPDIKVLYTNRLFYSKYLYKLSYRFDKARYLRYEKVDILSRFYRSGSLTISEYERILDFKNNLEKRKPNIAYRVEGNVLNIFSKSLQDLHDLAYRDLFKFQQFIVSISLPKSADIETEILSGKFISTLGSLYKYRVKTRSKFYKNIESKFQVGNYLAAIKSEIRIGKSFLDNFKNTNKYVNQGYFYCNDSGIVDLIRLIDYSLIIRVENVVSPT